MMTNTRPKTYFSEIDGLRALAVLAVLLYHGGIPFFDKGGFTGVDVFFVISGYVISNSLYNTDNTSFIRYIGNFYQRRIKRILPALTVCLLITVTLSTLFIPSSWLSNTIDQTGLSAFFGVSNFSLVFSHDAYFSPKVEYIPFLHTWSLAVEEQFYLLFPVLFFFWSRKNNTKSKRSLLAAGILPTLSLISLGLSIFETANYPDQAYYLLPSRFWELAAGALLFQIQQSGRLSQIKSAVSHYITAYTGIALIFTGIFFAEIYAFPFFWAIPSVLGTLLLLISITSKHSRSIHLHRLLTTPVLKYIGRISYSLYLWHWPVAAFMRWTVGFESPVEISAYIIISFALAILSYHYIERPLQQNRFISSLRGRTIIVTGMAAVALSFIIAKEIIDSKSELSLSVTSNNYIWHSGKYQRDIRKIKVLDDQAVNGRQIFAVGDSHTAAYRTMLNIASATLGIEVHEYEEGGCAVVGLLQPASNLPGCREFYQRVYQSIRQLARPGDIVFLASLRMPEIFGEDDDAIILNIHNSQESIENRRLALEEAQTIISEFEKLGLTVIIESPLPLLKSQPYRCSDWFNKTNPNGRLGLTISRAFLDKLREPILTSLTALKATHPKLHIWDPFPILCPTETFSAYDDSGRPLLFDSDHLTAHANRLLTPDFINTLEAIWHSESSN